MSGWPAAWVPAARALRGRRGLVPGTEANVRTSPRRLIAVLVAAWAWPGASESRGADETNRLAWPAVTGKRPPRQVGVIASSGDVKGGPAAASAERPGEALRLGKPFGVVVTEAERVFVADPAHRGVLAFDLKAATAVKWTGNAEFPLTGPVALALDRQGRVFAVDGYQAHVVVFDSSGRPAGLAGKNVLKRPSSIAIDDRANRVYVGDTKLNQVLTFDLETLAAGKPVGEPRQSGQPGSMALSEPGSLAVNAKGQLLVSDRWRRRVLIYNPGGALAASLETECGKEDYGRARAIAVDAADRVYVLDPDDDTLQVFTPEGSPLQMVLGLGAASKQGLLRTGIAVDGRGRAYVTEQQDGEGRLRILALNLAGQRGAPASAGARVKR